MSTGYGMGYATMGAVFPWIVHNFNWRYAWYFLGAGALCMVLVNALLLRSHPETAGYQPWGAAVERPRTGQTEPTSPTKVTPFSLAFKKRAFWLIGLSYLSVTYSLYAVTTFMVDYAKTQMGLPLEKASLLATVHGLAQVVGVLTILPLSDHLGRRNTIIISNVFITAAVAGILFSRTPEMLFMFVGIMAVFFGAAFPMYGACAGDYFPKDVMGSVIGAWTPFYGIGAILSHWVTGILRDSTGAYDHAFIISAAMAAAGVILMCLVKGAGRPSSAK
jgi:OFA family oxalate/formate antiporter-like MFS transporter